MFGNDQQLDPPHGRLSHADEAGARSVRQLVLNRPGQRFVFQYETGREAALLARLRTMAGDPNVKLSWFDAAILARHVGQRLVPPERDG